MNTLSTAENTKALLLLTVRPVVLYLKNPTQDQSGLALPCEGDLHTDSKKGVIVLALENA